MSANGVARFWGPSWCKIWAPSLLPKLPCWGSNKVNHSDPRLSEAHQRPIRGIAWICQPSHCMTIPFGPALKPHYHYVWHDISQIEKSHQPHWSLISLLMPKTTLLKPNGDQPFWSLTTICIEKCKGHNNDTHTHTHTLLLWYYHNIFWAWLNMPSLCWPRVWQILQNIQA